MTYKTSWKEKGIGLFGEEEVLCNGEIPTFAIIMTCQWNGNYFAESRNVEIPADQVKRNTTKKFVVLVQGQSHTVFWTSNSKHAAVGIDERCGE